jgi:hypothetical protein
MIKRSGQRPARLALAPVANMTSAEQRAYSEAFGTIEKEYQTLCSIGSKLREIERMSNNLPPFEAQGFHEPVELPESGTDRNPWEICAPLLQLDGSDVILCKRRHEHGVEYAVIDHSPAASAYAKANRTADILDTNEDPRQALQDYLRAERQALELMANDISASVRLFMAEHFPRQDVGRVVNAITRMCKKAARIELSESPADCLSRRQGEIRGVRV